MTGDTSGDDLKALGEELRTAKSKLTGLYDQLSLDYGSEAALRYDFTRDGAFGEVSDFRENDRETTWHIVPGELMAVYQGGRNMIGADVMVYSATVSQQAAAVASAELLEKTRSETETLSQLTGDDLDALASIPTVLGGANLRFSEVRQKLGENLDSLVDLMDDFNNNSNWTGDGSAAYAGALNPQRTAFDESRDVLDNLMEANAALAQMTSDLFVAFLDVRKAQWEALGSLGGVVFTLASPKNWLGIAQKMFDTAVAVKKKHIEEFEAKIQDLADSAWRKTIIEKAEATAAVAWPEAPSGISGNWTN